MVSIFRSMRSRSLSAELIDGPAALRLGHAFERGDVELSLDLLRVDAELASEIEEVLDLLGRSGSISGRAVLLAVGRLRRVLRRVVIQPRLGLRVRHLGDRSGLRSRVSVQLGFHAVADEREGLVDFGVELVRGEAIGEFDFDRGMERLAAVFGVSRDFLRLGCVEFQHGDFLSS